MSPQDLTNAIVSGINAGGEQFLREPWRQCCRSSGWRSGLHLGRPYILDMIDRFTLRLGADLLWLIYVALRDLLIVSGVVMSFMFFFPDVVITEPYRSPAAWRQLPFCGAAHQADGDPDHDPRAFRLVTYLLGLGALFYFVPYILGVQGNATSTATSPI